MRTSVKQVPESARGWIHKAGNDGFIKLVEDCDRGVLAGATSAGPCGGEVLGALLRGASGRMERKAEKRQPVHAGKRRCGLRLRGHAPAERFAASKK